MSRNHRARLTPVLRFTAQLSLCILTLCVAGIGSAVMAGRQIQGDEMAVLVDYAASTGLYTVDLNTQIRTQLASNVDRVKPAWSPDGSRIAFVLSNGPGADSIPELNLDRLVGIVNADGSNRRHFLRLHSTVYGLAWAPDGARIALEAEDGIYLVDADGNNLRKVVNGHGITWSPDSRQIIFERNFSLYVMDADGGDALPIDAGLQTIRPDWSPDGGRVAFYSQLARSYNLYVVDLTSGDTRPLTQGVRGCVFSRLVAGRGADRL